MADYKNFTVKWSIALEQLVFIPFYRTHTTL